jgi:hypothetical protein
MNAQTEMRMVPNTVPPESESSHKRLDGQLPVKIDIIENIPIP